MFQLDDQSFQQEKDLENSLIKSQKANFYYF